MDIEHEDNKYEIDNYPDTCPICQYGIESKLIGTNLVERAGFWRDKTILQLFFRCPRSQCQEAFIGNYTRGSNYGREYFLSYLAPYIPKEPEIIQEIKEISPNFYKIYSQAIFAEKYKLDQVCGVGYRKSLEFLIKDYLISQLVDEKEIEKIKAKYLGNCIEENISDIQIKNCAKLATWLGNDETHYARKWEDKDINDLKTLLELTIIWIKSNILTEKYTSQMTDKKK